MKKHILVLCIILGILFMAGCSSDSSRVYTLTNVSDVTYHKGVGSYGFFTKQWYYITGTDQNGNEITVDVLFEETHPPEIGGDLSYTFPENSKEAEAYDFE